MPLCQADEIRALHQEPDSRPKNEPGLIDLHFLPPVSFSPLSVSQFPPGRARRRRGVQKRPTLLGALLHPSTSRKLGEL